MKISIVTVTYNSANTIACTIESVLKQKYEDYEYIVVDGGSKDATVDIIKEWEPKFNGRMRWISEKDKGMYDGINKGIRMSTGDVVGIINSDDFYHREDIFQIINDTFKAIKSNRESISITFIDPQLGNVTKNFTCPTLPSATWFESDDGRQFWTIPDITFQETDKSAGIDSQHL